MLPEYIEQLQKDRSDELDGIDIQIYSPMPGVKAYHCIFDAFKGSHKAVVRPGYFEAVFCRAGRMHLTLTNGRTLALGAGELLLLIYTARLESISFEMETFECLNVWVNKQTVREVFDYMPPFDSPAGTRQLRALMDEHDGCMVLRDSEWGAALQQNLSRLPKNRHGAYFVLCLLERLCILNGETEKTATNEYYDSYQREKVRNVHDYMIAHPEQHLTISALAQRFQLSPTLLKGCFRWMYGEPIHTYLKRYRLQRASYLLRTTDEGMPAIASAVGYASASQFGVAFKKQYHMTPAGYRRVHQNQFTEQEHSSEN